MDGYNKVKILGKGTYGTVFLCTRKSTGNKIVLKEIDKTLSETGIQAANNEINILNSLKHPNIIQYHKHFVSKRFFCILMEFATKGNLYEYILKHRQRTYIAQQDVLNIFGQILLGLDYIHSKNVIHRDLKCENILITGLKYDLIKIADFGISKLLDSDGQTNTVIGTPNYLAPEICDGKPYNFKCDIWALGCILYELCALERMFEGNISNVVLSIAYGKIKEVNYDIYDVRIQEIIKLCLTTDPDYRPHTKDLMQKSILLPVLYQIFIDTGRIVY